MASSLTRLWLKGVRRVATAQRRQSAKFVKSLLVPAKAKRRSPLKAAAIPVRRKVPTAPPVRSTPASRPRTSLQGLWSKRAGPATASPDPATARIGNRAAPPRAPATGSFTRGLFKSQDEDASAMHYWLYWPSNAPASRRPLVVMLHGCGQTALEFAQGTRMNELAEKKGFAVLYPQQSVRREASRCWPWYTRQTQRGEGDAGLIAQLLQSVLTQYRVDRRRVYGCGISAGAAMAQILGIANPGLFAAVGMHSGPVFGTADSAARGFSVMQNGDSVRFARPIHAALITAPEPVELPALLIHGDHDKIVRPVNLMQVARQFLLLNGIKEGTVDPVLHEQPARPRAAAPAHAWRTLSYLRGGRPLVVACQITGLEHAWSGGARGLRFNSDTGPDASQMFWTFFARHRRDSAWSAAWRRVTAATAQWVA